MLLMSDEEWDKSIFELKHLKYLSGRSFQLPEDEVCYETSYDACGVVGAEIASVLLNEVVEGNILSGFISIVATYVTGDPQIDVLLQIASGLQSRKFSLPVVIYTSETDNKLLAILAWCISCGWRFLFLAEKYRFGIECNGDERIRISWNKMQPLKQNVPLIIKTLDFKESV